MGPRDESHASPNIRGNASRARSSSIRRSSIYMNGSNFGYNASRPLVTRTDISLSSR